LSRVKRRESKRVKDFYSFTFLPCFLICPLTTEEKGQYKQFTCLY